MCFSVLSSNFQDLTSFHASDSACDLKSKVLWYGLGLFGTLSETPMSKTREMDNMTNPIKTGQTVPALKIQGFEMCDFSLHVVTPTSKDMAVKYNSIFKLYICIIIQKESRNLKKINIDIHYKRNRQIQMSLFS